MKFKTLQMKRQFVSGKTIVGIDPAKRSHYCCMVASDGQPVGKGFSISNTHEGFHHFLWKKLAQRVEEINPETVVFAIETACNLWVNLAHYLCSSGYTVVLVSPLSTHRSRPLINHDFSKTDPKDAFLVASIAQDGFFDIYRLYSEEVKAMHHLSLSYDKLRKDYVRQRNRLRAFLDRVFPEFPLIVPLKTKSARYLLRHISHIGNRRLSWLLYKMSEETAKYVPEVRLKFLRRQLKAQ
ncbi:MAG: transposase, partial [bacterium]